MKRILFSLVILSLLLAGCQSTPTPTPTAAPIVVQDGLERTVTLAEPALRIVSAAPSNTEILFAIGAGAQVVGRDDFSDYPPEAQALPAVGGGWNDYNEEAIISLQPDLVLMAGINTPEQVKALEDAGITVYFLANPTTLEELYANLEIVGKLTGHEKEAADLAVSLRARVKAVTERIAAYSSKPVVFYELDASVPSSPWTAGPGTFIDTLIGMAGGLNLAGDLEGAWVQISQEELILRDPDIILLGDANYGVTVESVAQRPGWEVLKAVKDGKVFPFDDNLLSRPGPRLVDALEALAKILHP